MVVTYSPDRIDLQHGELGEPEYHAIGRIVRRCAEIEDIVTLFIADLAMVSEPSVTILLGQTPLSKKLSIANYLASVRGPDAREIYDLCFTTLFKEIISCRNAVVHGILLGRSADGRWAFRTVQTEEPLIQDHAIQKVISFTTQDLAIYADEASRAVDVFKNVLGVEAQLQSRRGRSLLPHRKSQQKAKQSVKPKHRRRSSLKKSQRLPNGG